MTTPTVGMVGNLTADPELRFSNAGKPFLRGRISVKPFVPGAAEQPPTEFYDLVCFGTLAENVAESCRKGSRIVVAGNLEYETWTGRDGEEHTTVKVVADAIGPDLRFTGQRSIRRHAVDRPSLTPPSPAWSAIHRPTGIARSRSR